MLFTCERKALLSAAVHAASVAPSAATIPIIEHVLIEAANAGACFRATDLERQISGSFEAEVKEAGSCTVPARLLLSTLKKLPEDAEISFVYDAGTRRTKIRAGRSRFEFFALPAEDFPSVSDEDKGRCAFEMAADTFREMLERVQFAMSHDESRYYLMGVYLTREGEELRAVATDGHRLALWPANLPPQAHGMPPVIIPGATVASLKRLLSGREKEITIEVSAKRISVDLDGLRFVSRLIDGTFPDYSRVIPKEMSRQAVANRELLADAIARAGVFFDRKEAPAIKFAFETGALTLSTRRADRGEAQDAIDLEAYQGEPLEIGFNVKYISDAIEHFGGNQVRLDFGGPAEPVVVRNPDGAHGALCVVMPMRVGW